MSTVLDETAAEVPVRDVPFNLGRLVPGPQESPLNQNVWAPQDVCRLSREELEDRFLRLHEETLLLKQHNHQQDDKIKKLGTKLMRLVKDRGRMEQLAAGAAYPVSRVRDIEMEEMMEELQEKVRDLQTDNEGLKQRLLVAKQQLMNSQSRKPSAYSRVPSRVNSGLKKPRDGSISPQTQLKSLRSLEGGRPPTGQLPRYGHSLLEQARAEIRNLENLVESQRSQMEELEATSQLLREEIRKKEAEYEEKLLQVRQQQASKLRSHVNSNMTMMKLQKQLAERSNAVTELEGRFLQLQENQQMLKKTHDAAQLKVNELLAQLTEEKFRNVELQKQLQNSAISSMKLEQLQERISKLEQERDLLKQKNEKLLQSTLDVSQQQKWQIQEQQLKLQIRELEMALNADLADKNEILDKMKTERDMYQKLTEENEKLQTQFLEQKQQAEELRRRLGFYSRLDGFDVAELSEAVLQLKMGEAQRGGDLGFLRDDERGSSYTNSFIKKLQAAHTETIQELEKTRSVLDMEIRISTDYKVELEAALKKMDSDKVKYQEKLEQQAQLLDTRAAKIKKLEAQLRDITYGTKTHAFKPEIPYERKADELDETLHLEPGENVLELHLAGASLSASALEHLGDCEPSTFLTYAFYLFELHSTPEVRGHQPKYSFTSRYVVRLEDRFLDYLQKASLTVELHQALGLGWRTLAMGQIQLQQLLEQEGSVHGTISLIGSADGVQVYGSLDYWLRLRIPMTDTIRLYKEKTLSFRSNELLVTVQRCGDLRSRSSQQPSPFVVYKFFDFPDYLSATVDDCCDPQFDDTRSYSVMIEAGLDQYLKSEVVQFYVFDYREEQMDQYLGKAMVPLLSLAQNKGITGVFELTDPSGFSAGHIELSLRWRLAYIPPSGPEIQRTTNMAPETEDLRLLDKNLEKENEASDALHHSSSVSSKAPPPKHETHLTVDAPAKKQVKFVDTCAADFQVKSEVTPAPQNAAEEEEEEESCVSEGLLVPPSPQSNSEDSENSEQLLEDIEEDQSESAQSDSDDCIVHGPAAGRKPSDRLRVEVVSLSLRPESDVAQDGSVVRLFVEYSLLDLPTEETPLSLPKPPKGKSINFNYSKVIPVDAENHGARRRLLRGVLLGQNPQLERIQFTVVSEPPEEEEQEQECEDVGVAFIRIPEILEKQGDLKERSLKVVDVKDGSQVVGTLTVSVEGLEALQAILQEQTPTRSLLSSA